VGWSGFLKFEVTAVLVQVLNSGNFEELFLMIFGNSGTIWTVLGSVPY
jgi:hypothetical protein